VYHLKTVNAIPDIENLRRKVNMNYVEDIATREKFLKSINDESERLTRLINDITFSI
jgi:signal transduction histidine kinase